MRKPRRVAGVSRENQANGNCQLTVVVAAASGTTLTYIRCSTPFFWNTTLPSTFANSVWSVPVPTFRPARTGVPRWRMMMFPARTRSPPKRFTPSRLEWESRPFLVLPPAFLCAMSAVSYFNEAAVYAAENQDADRNLKTVTTLARADVRDLHFGEELAVRLLAQIVRAPLELDDRDLGTFTLAYDSARDLTALQKGRA